MPRGVYKCQKAIVKRNERLLSCAVRFKCDDIGKAYKGDRNSKEYLNYRKKLWLRKSGKLKGNHNQIVPVGTYKTYSEYQRLYKIAKGIAGKPNDGRSLTPEYQRFYKKRNKAMRRKSGNISIKTIQLVYEDNIKKFGTLTCYLCLKPIEFSKDHLDHKTPLIRGGVNEYNNLGVACAHCNLTKNSKTEQEYRALTERC